MQQQLPMGFEFGKKMLNLIKLIQIGHRGIYIDTMRC
jgi:hypothetical protein